MFRKTTLLNFLAILCTVLVVVGVTARDYNSDNNAKAQAIDTPTYTCLGGCSQDHMNTHAGPTTPSKKKVTTNNPPVKVYATTSPTQTASVSGQPCSKSQITFQVPTGKNAVGSKNDRGGFLKLFFQVILSFMKVILDLLGMKATNVPCNTAGTISPTITIAISPTLTISPTPTTGSGSANNGNTVAYLGGYLYKSPNKPATSALSAKWTVPSLTDCGSLKSSGQFNPTASIYVGYQNEKNGRVTKVGTEQYCLQGSPVYKAYTDQYPDPAVLYPDNAIAPGDQMVATTTYTGADKFTVTLNNTTKNWTVTRNIVWGLGFDFANAEGVIAVENTGDFYSNHTLPPGTELALPHFSPDITFSNVTFSENGQTTKPLTQDLQGVKLTNNINREGTKQSDTGSNTDGSFTVTWQHN